MIIKRIDSKVIPFVLYDTSLDSNISKIIKRGQCNITLSFDAGSDYLIEIDVPIYNLRQVIPGVLEGNDVAMHDSEDPWKDIYLPALRKFAGDTIDMYKALGISITLDKIKVEY